MMNTPETSSRNPLARAMVRTFTLGQCLAFIWLCLTVLILGAHYYRAGDYGLAVCAGLAIIFLCTGSAWKQYAVALLLYGGALEWCVSAVTLAQTRLAFGMPWVRGAAILVMVAGLTALAGHYAFRRERRRAVENGEEKALFMAIVFMGVFVALLFIRKSVPVSMFLLERYLPFLGGVQLFFAAWYGAFVAGKIINPKTSRSVRRWFWLLFAALFFAQFSLGVIGFDRMLMTGTLHAPIPAFIIFSPIFRESFSMMPIIATVAVLLTGSAWCSMLCYFGPFDALAAGSKAAKPVPPIFVVPMRYGRAVVLVVGALTAAGLKAIGIATATAVSIVVVFGIVSLGIMALVSRRYRLMTHCTTFCPMGLVVNALARLSPWRMRIDTERCDTCRACEKICRYNAIDAESRAAGVTRFRCSLCRDCLSVCKNGAISLSCPGLAPQTAHTLFVGLIAGLHAVFLNVAMV